MARHEIASKILRTGKGNRVYVARDLAGQLFVHCEGCRTDTYRPGMAPALAGAVQHAGKCGK